MYIHTLFLYELLHSMPKVLKQLNWFCI